MTRASDAAIERAEAYTAVDGTDAYAALKAFGCSPFKAAEIALDHRRGDPFASFWVACAIAAQGGEE